MIRRLILSLALVAALAACDTMNSPPVLATAGEVVAGGPVVIADRVTLDETAGQSVELAYKAARTAVEFGVDAGLIKGESAGRVQLYNRRAFAAVQVARTAYRTGNATSVKAASAEARAAIADFLSLLPSRAK